MVEFTTPHGQYRLSVEMKKSYLNMSLVNAILSRTRGWTQPEDDAKRRGKLGRTKGRLVLARYIPAATGEQFIDVGISFADEPGNIHLRLGSEYNWTVLGKREPPKLPEAPGFDKDNWPDMADVSWGRGSIAITDGSHIGRHEYVAFTFAPFIAAAIVC